MVDARSGLLDPCEGCGRRALERQAAIRRADERQAGRVEADAAQRVPATAVRLVADDRMAERGQLCPDLTAAAGRERDLDRGDRLALLDHAVARDRLLTLVAAARRAN